MKKKKKTLKLTNVELVFPAEIDEDRVLELLGNGFLNCLESRYGKDKQGEVIIRRGEKFYKCSN